MAGWTRCFIYNYALSDTEIARLTSKPAAAADTRPRPFPPWCREKRSTLSWPSNYIGSRLLMQTNRLTNGISFNTNDWATVPVSQQTNQVSLPIDPTLPAEFYRLIYP